ncbi:MAG: mandelate racemase [Hyphomicrobiales bacterium]
MTPKLRVIDVRVTTRPVGLRLPFRYGVVTLREAREARVSVRIQLEDGSKATGHSAELLAPKWFDKSPELSNEENVGQLLRSVELARQAYLATDAPLTTFDLHARHDASHRAACADENLNALIAGFGNAILDKAIIGAVCSALDSSFFKLVRSNAINLNSATAPDLAGFDFDGFLARLAPQASIIARHTVGLVDAIFDTDIDPATRVDDGQPESLEAAIKAWGLKAFKIKVGGDLEKDIEQLARVASLLDRSEQPYLCTLDGNEQYRDAGAFAELHSAMLTDRRLSRLVKSVYMIEQPIARHEALSKPLGDLGESVAIEIDESDNSIDAFAQARALGYRGISSKSCKGIYRSLLNCARVTKWNSEEGTERYFMSAEDLSTQPGLALQQDLALATLIGCTHVERNGHFYGDGRTGIDETCRRFYQESQPGLYRLEQDSLQLAIKDGVIDLHALDHPGSYTDQP